MLQTRYPAAVVYLSPLQFGAVSYCIGNVRAGLVAEFPNLPYTHAEHNRLVIPAACAETAPAEFDRCLRAELRRLIAPDGEPLGAVAYNLPACESSTRQSAGAYLRAGDNAADKINAACEPLRRSHTRGFPASEYPSAPLDVLDVPEGVTPIDGRRSLGPVGALLDYCRDYDDLTVLPRVGKKRASKLWNLAGRFSERYSPPVGAGLGNEYGAVYIELTEAEARAVAYALPGVRGELEAEGRPLSDYPTLHRERVLRLPPGSRWHTIRALKRWMHKRPSESDPVDVIRFGDRCNADPARRALDKVRAAAGFEP